MAIGAILAGLSILSGNKQRRAQKKAARTQNQIVALRNNNERINALREYRAARAQVIAGVIGAGGGAQGNSAVPGITGSLRSQVGSNLEFNKRQEQLGEQAAKQTERAADWQFVTQALQVGGQVASAVRTIRPQTPVNPSPFQG